MTFTYLGSTLAEDGELDAKVTHIVQSGWRKNWKRVSGVLCNSKTNVKNNEHVYMTVERPALMYGAATCVLKKAHDSLVASPMCPIGNPEMLSTSNFYDGNVICVVWKDKLA